MTETLALAKSMAGMKTWLEAAEQQHELAKLLPDGMTPAHFTRIVMNSALRNPAIAECDKGSVWLAVVDAAGIGLPLDGTMAAIVPYGGVAKLMVMYRGYIQLAYRHPSIAGFIAHPVFEGEPFRYEEGARTVLRHTPLPPSQRGGIVGAYARVSVRGGDRVIKWMWREEIEHRRESSASYRKYLRTKNPQDSAWVQFEVPMFVKTPVREISKFIPQSPQLIQALAVDDDPMTEPAPGSPHVPGDKTVGEICDTIARGGEPEEEAHGDADRA